APPPRAAGRGRAPLRDRSGRPTSGWRPDPRSPRRRQQRFPQGVPSAHAKRIRRCAKITIMTTRWGIIATGTIAAALAEDLARVPAAELVAVGSRPPERANDFAARYGIPRAYGSWAELAADPEVDVVYVATPHSAHHAAARLCLESGKAVLCE